MILVDESIYYPDSPIFAIFAFDVSDHQIWLLFLQTSGSTGLTAVNGPVL